MNPWERLTETAIRVAATVDVFARGKNYYRDGAVLSLVSRSGVLRAAVRGSEPAPYQVTVTAEENGSLSATCTCPYDWDGLCKHAVAVLLACVAAPEEVVQRPSLPSLLEALERDRLQDILLFLAERRPELEEMIELLALAPTTPPEPGAAARPNLPAISPSELKQAQAAVLVVMRSASYGRGYRDGRPNIAGEVEEIAHRARPYLDTGDGPSALALLETVIAEAAPAIEMLGDEDRESYELCSVLGALLAEAILTTDLKPEERRQWVSKIEQWQSTLSDYGLEDGLEIARRAAREGWDTPALRGLLSADPSAATEADAGAEAALDEDDTEADDEEEEFEEEDYGDDEAYEDEFAEQPWRSPYAERSLTQLRLEILGRQGRWPEYLRLARATGQSDLYVTALIGLGRVEEAVEYGLTSPLNRLQALSLCRALDAAGASEPALRVAERVIAAGEEPGFHAADLAVWARGLAERLGLGERALAAAKAALRSAPNLENYQAAERLVGNDWPELREETLKRLRAVQGYQLGRERVDIFLHEGLVDDAIAVADAAGGHDLVARVVEAATGTHPDWVFRACVRQFDRIADPGNAQYYHEAAEWLSRARAALVGAGRTMEWRRYLDGAIQKHTRKYKLRPMLEALRLK